MPRWEYMMNQMGGCASGSGGGGGGSARRSRFPLIQGERPTQLLAQRGFVSPRNILRLSDYEMLEDSESSHLGMQGYIPPGTHSIPTPSSYGRRPPLHGSTFLSSLGRQRFGPGYHSLGPIFDDEDTFFPPETLPPIDEDFFEGSGSAAGANFSRQDDERTREQFEERLSSFPEVPLDAHRRIFQMGNDIVECFDTRLERFYRGTLLDSISDCIAVFTKKERTGQRWLMVFKEDITRTVVKFNRLLTHSLMVSIVNSTAIEIEAAKSLYGPPAEMCVINFLSTDDASRFFKILQESQATAWNHREVTHEQRMKTLFTKINVAIAQADLMGSNQQFGGGHPAPSLGARQRASTPAVEAISNSTRTPFTLLRDRGGGDYYSLRRDPCRMLSHSKAPGRTPRPTLSDPTIYNHQQFSAVADLDDDWRSKSPGGENNGDFFRSVSSSRNSPGSSRSRTVRKCGNIPSAQILARNISKGPKTSPKFVIDGSGDCVLEENNKEGQKTEEDDNFPQDIVFEVFVTVFAKIDSDYAEVGTGTLQLVDHKDLALDELRLLGGTDNKDDIIQQYIYKWNSCDKILDSKNSSMTCVCLWNGAASFSVEPDAVPERREFKVRLSSEKEADAFVETFMKSVEKAKDEEIRRRHISWYLQNKREYKTPPTPTSF